MEVCVWVHICGCGCVCGYIYVHMWVCVCVKPSANKPQERRNRPVYRSHDIIHNLGAQYIRSLRGGAITGGEGGLNFSVSVYNAVLYVGIPVVWGPAGAAPMGSYGGSSRAAHKRDPGGWLGPPLKGPRKSAAPWMQASRLNNGRNPHTLNRLSHNLLLSSFSGS